MHDELKNQVGLLLSKQTRLDGRTNEQYREISVEYGVSKNAEGSARVKIGETEVISGVKMEVMKPYSDRPDAGSLMVNVELNPLSSPEFENGPPSILAIELARITDRCIRESKAIDVKKLCIKSGEKMWMVVIDVCTLNDAGNLFDAVALAAVAAVTDAVFPAFDGEIVDYKNKTSDKLPLSKTPVSTTIYKYGDHLLVDPTSDEEKVYDSRMTVGVLEDGSICSLQKGGDDAIEPDIVVKMIELAKVKSQELRKNL
ncbi:exosome complex protein Rrp42 [Candidatus Woesearchaeota archaeon]|nr:exosome complex protein Rrp42 [Candidatus Woesearchaeota archaeon]